MSEQGSTGEVPGGAAAEAVAKRARSRQVRDKGLVEASRSGDKTAFGKLYDHWVDSVYDRAVNGGASAAEAREITEQTFTAAWRDLGKLKQPAAFGAKVLQVTRRETIQRVPAGPKPVHLAAKSGSSSAEERLSRATNAQATAADHDVALVLREAATALDDRTREVLDLHFRQGLTRNETAAVLGEQPDKVTETVTKLPLALGVLTRARVLWRGGSPEDPELAKQLKDDGVASFNAAAVRSINRFAKGNDRARARSLIGIPPIELYAAIPLADAPAGLKMAVASTLVAEGVPMEGSKFVKRDDKGEILDQPKRVSKSRDVGAEKLPGDGVDRSIRPGLDEKRPSLDTKKAAAVAAAAVAAEKKALLDSAEAAAVSESKVEERGSSRKERKQAKADSARADDVASAAAAATAADALVKKEASAKDAANIKSSRTPDEELPGRHEKDDLTKAEKADEGDAEVKDDKAKDDKAKDDKAKDDKAKDDKAKDDKAKDDKAKDDKAKDDKAKDDKAKDKDKDKDKAAGAIAGGAAAGLAAAEASAEVMKSASSKTGPAKGAAAEAKAGGDKTGSGKGDTGTGKTGVDKDDSAKSSLAPSKAAASAKPSPIVATARRDDDESAGGAGKFIAVAVVVVLLLGGLAFALTRGSGDNSAGVQTGPKPTVASSSTTAASTTTTPDSTTTASTIPTSSTDAPTTTAVTVAPTSASVVGPGPIITTAPATTTTLPVTTTTNQYSTILITKFSMDRFYGNQTYSTTATTADAFAAPTLSWDVSGASGISVAVTVTPPGGSAALVPGGTALSNPGIKFCPIAFDSANKCQAIPGVYQIKIVVHPSDNSPDKVQQNGFTMRQSSAGPH